MSPKSVFQKHEAKRGVARNSQLNQLVEWKALES
jgi:hypothetical protein